MMLENGPFVALIASPDAKKRCLAGERVEIITQKRPCRIIPTWPFDWVQAHSLLARGSAGFAWPTVGRTRLGNRNVIFPA